MRCTAIAETTGERCRRQAVNGMEVCAAHTPANWHPRLDRPVTVSREEIEALMGGGDKLILDYVMIIVWRRLKVIERSNLGFLAKVERAMPHEDMLLRIAVMRKALNLCQEAADLLNALDVDDLTEQANAKSGGPPKADAGQPLN